MNIAPGYFGADYWPVDYWDDNYWPDAGTAVPVVPPTVGATPRRRRIPVERLDLIAVEDEEILILL